MADRRAVSPPDGRYVIRIGDDGETNRFAYPSAGEVPSSYIAGVVLLGFGARNVIDPNERHEVHPDIAALASELCYPSATATIVSVRRVCPMMNEPGVRDKVRF